MENYPVTHGFNKEREGVEHLNWICDLCCLAICIYLNSNLHSLQVKKIIGKVTAKNYLKEACRLFCASLFKAKVLQERV